jgi:hypothetical protein
MRTRLSLTILLLAGGLMAGCGAADTGGGNAAPESSAAGGPIVSDSPPAFDPTGGSSGKQQPSITITGTPTEGVENGCIVMQSGNTLYLLLGGERSALMSGRPVAVRGTPAPGLMTTCQQGTPFQVTDVKPA